jgi:hypothetical protein
MSAHLPGRTTVTAVAIASMLTMTVPQPLAIAQLATPDPRVSSGSDLEVELAVDVTKPVPPRSKPRAAEPTGEPTGVGRLPRLDALGTSVPASMEIAEPARARRPAQPANAGGHRLQAPFPDHNVVVCLAGCVTGRETIVFFERRTVTDVITTATAPVATGFIRVADAGSSGAITSGQAPVAEPGGVTCVAGCYNTPKTYSGRRDVAAVPAAAPVTGRVFEGTWLTAAKEPVTVPAPAPTVKKRRPTSGGSDWFTKRF